MCRICLFRLIIIAICFIPFLSSAQLTLEGVFSGENVYIRNPYSGPNKDEFCTDSVLINGIKLEKKEFDSAYEIPLDSIADYGDSIVIEIFHKGDCTPRALNMGHPKTSKLTFRSISIDSNGLLKWTIAYTPGVRLGLFLERYIQNKWVYYCDVEQKWDTIANYSQHIHLYPGINTFRVVSGSRYFSRFVSDEVTYFNDELPITFKIDSTKKQIIFKDLVYAELRTQKNNVLVKYLKDEKIMDISNLKKMNYLLYYNEKIFLLELKKWK